MKVAITGATGFIGRYVLQSLQRHNVEIVAITRGCVSGKLFSDNVECVQLDVLNSSENAYDLMGRPDTLIHLAWGGLPNYKSDHHLEVELPSQYHFLENLVSAGLSSLFVAGTCFEYGMQSGSLCEITETVPDNPYGQAKDQLRKKLELLQERTSFALTWGRLFYLYGEGQSESSLYTLLHQAIERGDKVFNMSGGEQVRDFLPVNLVAEKIVSLALLKEDVGIVNIASGEPTTVRDLVQLWLKEKGSQMELNLGYYPYPDYEPMEFWANVAKLRSLNDRFEAR